MRWQDQEGPPGVSHNSESVTAARQSLPAFSFNSLPTEVMIKVLHMLTLPATASLMQTCKHFRILCMDTFTWEPHAGEFRAIDSKARTHYRRCSRPISQPASHSAHAHLACTQSPDQLAEPANYQRYSWCPVPGETHMRRKFSSGKSVAEPAWLSLMPHVACKGNTWLYVKTKALAGSTQ